MLTFVFLLMAPAALVLSNPTPCCRNHKFMANFYTFGANVLATGEEQVVNVCSFSLKFIFFVCFCMYFYTFGVFVLSTRAEIVEVFLYFFP